MCTATPASAGAPVAFHPNYVQLSHLSSTSPSGQGLTPSQIRHAYGLDQVTFGSVQGDGSGQTIAIIDAYNSPTIVQDLHAFDLAFGLPDPPSFRVVSQTGSTSLPRTDPSGPGTNNWEGETALDVEWAHALAPKANLLLVEANSPTDQDLMQVAVNYARQQPGVVAISMSFGGGEYSGQQSLDSFFTTPAGHGGVTFVASTGDTGQPGGYPATSPNVLAVGGTRLSVDSTGNYLGESGWSGSGGGMSSVEAPPSYQTGILSGLVRRGTPDVSFDADPNSGVPVYDSYNGGSRPWEQVGGTSFSAPAWAAIIAVADQGRSIAGLGSLDGRTQTLPMLYSLPGSDFHDITSGNNGYSARVGYDLVTGRGSPLANLVIAGLVGSSTSGGSGSGGGSSGGGSSGGGNSGGGGTGSQPANDNFASGTSLSGQTANVTGSNLNATRETGEPSLAGTPGGASVWWTWTAPASGSVVLSTAGSNFDTTLGVFTGSTVSTLTSIAANDDQNNAGGILTSRVTFNAVAGTTYHLAVDGYNAATGNISLGLTETVTTTSPPTSNDNFAQRVALSGANVSTTGSNVGATRQSGEPVIAGVAGGHSVWWSWTAPSSGNVTIRTAGSNFDTLLGVYTGSTLSTLQVKAANDDQNYFAGIVTSQVTFTAVAGTTYQIVVDGYHGAAGNIALAISSLSSSSSGGSGTSSTSGSSGFGWFNWPFMETNRSNSSGASYIASNSAAQPVITAPPALYGTYGLAPSAVDLALANLNSWLSPLRGWNRFA